MNSNLRNLTSPTGELAAFLLDPEKIAGFEFYELTDILVGMWDDARIPLRKSFIDYIIIAAINQRGSKGITRQQYVELTYLLVPLKVKKCSKNGIESHKDVTGFFDYI